MLHARMVALPCWPFDLSPLNELYIGIVCGLSSSHTLCDILMIFGIHVYHVKTGCHMQKWLFSLAAHLSYLP